MLEKDKHGYFGICIECFEPMHESQRVVEVPKHMAANKAMHERCKFTADARNTLEQLKSRR